MCKASQILTGNSSNPNSASMNRGGYLEWIWICSKRPSILASACLVRATIPCLVWIIVISRKLSCHEVYGKIGMHQRRKVGGTYLSNLSIWKWPEEGNFFLCTYFMFVCCCTCCVCLYLYEEGGDGEYSVLWPFTNNDVIREKALCRLSHFMTYRRYTTHF